MSSTGGMMETLNKKYKSFKKVLSSLRRGKKLKSHEVQECLRVLNEENVAMKQQLQEKQLELEKATQENETLKSNHETKEALFEEDKRFLLQEIKSLKAQINEKYVEVEKVTQENLALRHNAERKEMLLKEELDVKEALKEEVRVLQQDIFKLITNLEDDKKEMVQKENTGVVSNILKKEVDSLRDVLDLKQDEIKSMQTALVEAKQNEIALDLSMRKMRTLRAKCEDMQEQLKKKSESERDLETEIYKLRKNILEENSQNRKLSYKNEELNWKLTHNKKVGFDRVRRSQLEAPISPKVRKIVKKRKSVSYILDLEESCKQSGKMEDVNGDVEKLLAKM